MQWELVDTWGGPECYQVQRGDRWYCLTELQDTSSGWILVETAGNPEDFGTTRALVISREADFDLAQAAALQHAHANVLG